MFLSHAFIKMIFMPFLLSLKYCLLASPSLLLNLLLLTFPYPLWFSPQFLLPILMLHKGPLPTYGQFGRPHTCSLPLNALNMIAFNFLNITSRLNKFSFWAIFKMFFFFSFFFFPFRLSQAVQHLWKASLAVWRRPSTLGTWSRMPFITSLQLISSTLSSPLWNKESKHRPCHVAIALWAHRTLRKPSCSALMMSFSTCVGFQNYPNICRATLLSLG